MHVSDSSSVHHQEFFTVNTAMVSVIQLASRIRTELQFRPDPARKLSANLLWHIPLLCVQWKTPDDGQRNCPKHVEFYSKNKFEKLVHLVGFTTRTSFLCPPSGVFHCTHRKPLWHIPLLCVQWKTPDDGQQRNCLKHAEFYSKNKFEKLVHLVGFIIRISHDARSPERQRLTKSFKSFRMVNFRGDSRYAIPLIKQEYNPGLSVDCFFLIKCITHFQFKNHIIS